MTLQGTEVRAIRGGGEGALERRQEAVFARESGTGCLDARGEGARGSNWGVGGERDHTIAGVGFALAPRWAGQGACQPVIFASFIWAGSGEIERAACGRSRRHALR